MGLPMPPMPDHMLPRPPMPDDPALLAAFDALLEAAVRADPGGTLDYRLAAPKWQFLCHVADQHGLILHGSQNAAIARFEPRKANDAHPFGDRSAVYGARDGIWPLYYAILDRATHPILLLNSAVRIESLDGTLGEPHYFFSISESARVRRPYRPGTVYLLPASGFEAMPPMVIDGARGHVPQWACLSEVTPLARLAVDPEDFPFLQQMRGHDDVTVLARARANPDGFPWLD